MKGIIILFMACIYIVLLVVAILMSGKAMEKICIIMLGYILFLGSVITFKDK